MEQTQVSQGEYLFSRHGDRERQNDNLSISEIEEALFQGRILEHYPNTGRGESCLVAGFTKQGCGLWAIETKIDNYHRLHSFTTQIQKSL